MVTEQRTRIPSQCRTDNLFLLSGTNPLPNLVAARLLLIKSQILLPRPEAQPLAVDEEDPGEALARQLREYRQFKTAAQYLKDRLASGARTFVRIASPPKFSRTTDLSNVTLDDLLATWRQALLSQFQDEDLAVPSTRPTITIDDRMAFLRRRLAQEGRITFSSLLGHLYFFQKILS